MQRAEAEAEAQAFACCVVEWLNHNPERSPAGRCLACGGLLLPYSPTQRPRMDAFALLAGLVRGRKAKAAAALAAMGIAAPVIHPIERERQSEHLSSNATRESRTVKNQFACQRQINGG